MKDDLHFLRLWDLYSPLLTATQKEVTDLYFNYDLSLGEIGKEFGDKDHSTVHHSIKVVEDNRNTNSRIKQSIEEIIANVRNR
jgi:predicted DNA-binding protein YlxM (UPF0122 family)